MVRRIVFGGVSTLILVSGLASIALAKAAQVPTVRLHSQVEINAAPAAVWAQLTQGRSLVASCPMWKSAKNAAVNLARVGDVLDYTDEWGNGGHSIVTYWTKAKELRVTHEPTRGDYMCQAKVVLTPGASGTRVDYWEQYTDESAPKDMEATAGKMETEMAQTLETIKKACEKK